MPSARDERRRQYEVNSGRNPEPGDPEADDSGLKFFLAAYQGGFREARIYRGYPDAGGVSFVYAGPAILFLDLEVARGAGAGGWRVKAADSLKTGLVGAAGAGLVILAVIIAIAGRLALKDARNATDLIGMGLAFITIFAVATIVALTSALRRITRRVAVLDAMSAEQIREESESEKLSFRATAVNVDEVKIEPHDPQGGGRQGSAARLIFRHDPTGKWKLSLLKRKDLKVAARAFRKLLGKDRVEVTASLRAE
jgi:hypothetical protein